MTKTEAKWRSLLREQAKSGLTVKEFAARRGLVANTLSWWRCRLRRLAAEAGAAVLVPVEVVDREAVETHVGGFEIQLGDGTVLRVPRGFDATELTRLLRTLRQTC